MYAGLCRLYGVVLVMSWACRACQVVDLIYLDIERECDIMPYEFKILLIKQVLNVLFAAGKEIVDT